MYVVKLCGEELVGDATVPCVYVGETGTTPRRRFLRHKEGGRTSVKEVRLYGLRLLPAHTRGIGPFATRDEALAAEKAVAARLRGEGFRVYGGQGSPFMDEPVEAAIRDRLRADQRIERGRRRAAVVVKAIDDGGVLVEYNDGKYQVRLQWQVLEGAGRYLAKRKAGWIFVGGGKTDLGSPTLDRYLKKLTKQAIAAWVAALLHAAGLVEVDNRRRMRIRWL